MSSSHFFVFFQFVTNVQLISWQRTFVNYSFRFVFLSWRLMFFFFLQLSLLIDVILRRYNRRRRRIDFALSVCFRRDNVRNQNIMIFAILRSMLFNLMFIFFNVSDICSFTINVDSKTSTRWKRNSDVETSISSINLLRSKLLISLMKCSLRLFKKNSFKVVRILVKTSRRLMNDDITSIRAENLSEWWF